MEYGWISSEQSRSLRDNAASVELSLTVKRTTTSGARRKRKQEEEEHRLQAEEQVNECSLDVTFDVVARAMSFFDLFIAAASQLGRAEFQQKLTKNHLTTLTSIAIASVIAHALPVRPGAFLSVKHRMMRSYIDVVMEHPDDWQNKAPTSVDFKNRNTTNFTHEALCLPPRICRVLRDYDDYVAPPPTDEESFFFRNTAGESVRIFSRSCSRVMMMWADKITGTEQGQYLNDFYLEREGCTRTYSRI